MSEIVTINGVEYVPKETVVSKDVTAALNRAYTLSFCYGIYDPCCDCCTVNHLRQIWDALHDINKELRFRQ